MQNNEVIMQRDVVMLVGRREGSKVVLCLEVDGKRVAKRYPGKSWIMLEPGWRVYGAEPGAEMSMTIEYLPEEAGPQ